jgi:mRNA-degrading endonuclease RelE of RelBE toxin-antitoxin system
LAHRYDLDFDPRFDVDLSLLDAFAYPRIRSAVLQLRDQAETRSRNRRPLRGTVWWCPDATWQARVGDFRILYRVEGRSVELLRVKYKGTRTTEEMGP